MTAVVGLEYDGVVFIGGDAACALDLDVDAYRDTKAFVVGEIAIGFCGSPRLGQILKNGLTPPKHKPARSDAEYVTIDLIRSIRRALQKNGYIQDGARDMDAGDAFLLGYRGALYSVAQDYQALQPIDGWTAIGSGADLAKGAMFVDRGKDPAARIRRALGAAARYNGGVREPFTIVSSPKNEKTAEPKKRVTRQPSR